MTWFPSSELLLDPSPPRVADTVPGQLARSTARELALQRSRAPRPFATRGASPGRLGFALGLANEAWNLLLQQDIPLPEQEYPVVAPAGNIYRLRGTVTFKRTLPPPWDEEFDQVVDTLVAGAILRIGVLRKVELIPGGGTSTWQGVGVVQELPGQIASTIIYGGAALALWRLIRTTGLSLTLHDTPDIPIPGSFPPNTRPEAGDSPDNDLEFPITIPGGIPGLLLPIIIPIIIPRPGDLGGRPIPILYPPSIPLPIRLELPQMWLTPLGIQVGIGIQGDPIVTTVHDTITNITNITQIQDFRERIPPPVTTCTPDPEPPGDCCDCDEIRAIVVEELDSKFPPKRPFTLETIVTPAANSANIPLPAHTTHVTLTIVTPPTGVRSQFGGSNAPEIFYNGWYSLGVSARPGERIPLNYNSISVPVPAGANSFSYTIVYAGTASVTVNYRLPI